MTSERDQWTKSAALLAKINIQSGFDSLLTDVSFNFLRINKAQMRLLLHSRYRLVWSIFLFLTTLKMDED